MDREKQREIASKGGRAAHQKGTAHRWTEEEAKEAGRKGGAASHRNGHRTSAKDAMETPVTEEAPAEESSTDESSTDKSAEDEMRNGG